MNINQVSKSSKRRSSLEPFVVRFPKGGLAKIKKAVRMNSSLVRQSCSAFIAEAALKEAKRVVERDLEAK